MRHRIAATLALLAMALVASGPATARPGFALARLEGTNRYETARRIAEATFGSAATALIATGDGFADALAGNALAGRRSAPILLTPTGDLASGTRDALASLRTRSVTILGGEAAVSAAVENSLRAIDSTAGGGGKLVVSRIGGADRFDTARLLAVADGPFAGVVAGRRTAILATGEQARGGADALASGPLAYAARLPVLLTDGSGLHPQARAALQALAVQHVLVMGGGAAISAEIEDEVRGVNGPGSITTQRLEGSDRAETARSIAEYALSSLAFTAGHVSLARGDDFPDALAGGAHAGVGREPILLARSAFELSNVSDRGARRYLADHAPTLQSGHILGGPTALSPAVAAEATAVGSGS